MNQEIIDAVRKEIVARVYNQKKWLTSLTVALPPDEAATDWASTVQQVLADLRLDNVEIIVDDHVNESPWLRAVELGEGWY